MANATADYGFAFVRSYDVEATHIECAVLTGGSDLFVGDPVVLAGSGDSQGRPTVTRAADDTTTVNVFGVIDGIKATGSDGLNKQFSDSADTVIVIPTMPGYVFRVNASNTTGVSLNDIGQRMDHVQAAGDSKTGRSGYALDVGEDGSSPSPTTNGWLLIGFDRRADNSFSTTVSTDTINVDCLVTCVESSWSNGNGAA